jgi:hypothetical protein
LGILSQLFLDIHNQASMVLVAPKYLIKFSSRNTAMGIVAWKKTMESHPPTMIWATLE